MITDVQITVGELTSFLLYAAYVGISIGGWRLRCFHIVCNLIGFLMEFVVNCLGMCKTTQLQLLCICHFAFVWLGGWTVGINNFFNFHEI